MKNLLPLFILLFFLTSCEKEEPEIINNVTTDPIIGKWGPWERHVLGYDSLGNSNLWEMRQGWGGSIIEFKTDNSITHTVIGNYNASGNYLITGNKIKLNLSQGVFNINGDTINIITPNPYAGYIDTLSSKRLVFRDTIFNSNGSFYISTFSADRQ